MLAGLAITIAAFAWWRGSRQTRVTPPSPVASLDGPAALEQGVERVNRGQRQQSLPFFERALEAGTGRDNQVVSLYAAVLQDVALDSTMRSSVERTEAMHRALHAIERVAARANSPEQRAAFLFQHAYVLRVFGFPVDAMVELNLAASQYPNEESIDGARYGLAMRLREPENPAR